MPFNSDLLILIPAKGGSTRLKRKNILPLAGKTLLQRAVEDAVNSGLSNDIVVSTEDKEIAELAISYGAHVPFTRPEELAIDPAGVEQVALHALDELSQQGQTYKTLMILLPTCPLRQADDLKLGYEMFVSAGGKFLMSVAEYEHSPFSAWTLNEDNTATPVFEQYYRLKSQVLPKAYRCNGAIHILDVAAFQETQCYTSSPLMTYIMPRERSFDIDTKEDLLEAEAYLEAKNKHIHSYP